MDKSISAHFSLSSNHRMVLKNVFWVERKKSQPEISIVNLELLNDGITIFDINPQQIEDRILSFKELGIDGNKLALDYEVINVKNKLFAGLIIWGKTYFIVSNGEIKKIESMDINDLDSISNHPDDDYEGKNLNEADDLTPKVVMKFTSTIKNAFLDAFGFPKIMDSNSIKRLVLMDTFRYDERQNELIYCNLEIFKNGYRTFEKDSSTLCMRPEGTVTEYKLVPLKSGSLTALIIKNHQNQYGMSKEYYMFSNKEAIKFQNINIKKDLYMLIEDEELPESDDFFDGQGLELTEKSVSHASKVLNKDVLSEFQAIISKP